MVKITGHYVNARKIDTVLTQHVFIFLTFEPELARFKRPARVAASDLRQSRKGIEQPKLHIVQPVARGRFPRLDGRVAAKYAELGIVARDLVVGAVAERHVDHVAVLVNKAVGNTRLIDQRERQGPSKTRRDAPRDG